MRPLLLAAAAALLFAGAGSAYDRPACATPDTRSAWNAVFGHASTKAGAQALRRRAEAFSFKHLRLTDRGCGHWQVEVRDAVLGSFKTRQAFYAEAQKAGFVVSFEPPPSAAVPVETVTAVFGHRRTLALAAALRRRVSAVGYHETALQARGPHDWAVAMPHVPAEARDEFLAEARRAGFRAVLELN